MQSSFKYEDAHHTAVSPVTIRVDLAFVNACHPLLNAKAVTWRGFGKHSFRDILRDLWCNINEYGAENDLLQYALC